MDLQANTGQDSERNYMTDNIDQAEKKHSRILKPIPKAAPRTAGNGNLDLLLSIELPISVSFGSSEMQLEDVMNLCEGSVIELDRSVNDPVTIIVNHTPIAKGEMVVIEGNYGVRILEVGSTADRIRSLE